MSRPWEIWLVHHTQVDIGYTEPQEIILRQHAEFIAQALDYCTATEASNNANYPKKYWGYQDPRWPAFG